MLTEQELIYWYSVIYAYLQQLQNSEKENFLDPLVLVPENGQSLWTESRLNIIFILCGMYTKKELVRLQSLNFKKYEGKVIQDIQKETEMLLGGNRQILKDKMMPMLQKKESGVSRGSLQKPEECPINNCIQNVTMHNELSIFDQLTEIQCIEQNLQSFHDMPNYYQLYRKFNDSFDFDISKMS